MKITTSITIDEELINKLDRQAEKENRTRSNMVEVILKRVLDRQEDDEK